MVHRSTLKTARTLLDRFFRDAEGRTNHQLDVEFLLGELNVTRDRAEPALDYLVSRGLLNSFGPDVAYLTDSGVRACAEDVDIGTLGPSRSFSSTPSSTPSADPPPPEPSPASKRPVETGSGPDGPRLIHVGLDGRGRAVLLAARCTVGRTENNDIQIDDQRASKHHAVVRFERGAYVLEDLESANGTLLNGHYCVEPTRLKNDDEIVIGRTMLLFQSPDEISPPVGQEANVAPARVVSTPSPPPTRRAPSPPPEVADPGVRVVRGRPDPAPGQDPGALFESQRSAPADVFADEGALDPTAPPRDGPPISSMETAPTSRLSSDLQDSLHDLQPTLLPPEPGRASPLSRGLEALRQPSEPAPGPLDRAQTPPRPEGQEVLELSEVVETPTPQMEPPTQELDSEPEPTLIGRMGPGEALPSASSSLADVPLPPELRARLESEGAEGLYGELLALRAHVVELGGREHRLVKTIDTLLQDPIVRAYVDHARSR